MMLDILSDLRFFMSAISLKIARRIPYGFRQSIKSTWLIEAIFELIKDQDHRMATAHRRLLKGQREDILRRENSLSDDVFINIFIDTTSKSSSLNKTLESIRSQQFKNANITLLVAENFHLSLPRECANIKVELKPNLSKSLEGLEGTYLLFLEAGDILHDLALSTIASAIVTEQYPDVFYCDSDFYTEKQEHTRPLCKPAWSPDYFLEYDYIRKGILFRAESVIIDSEIANIESVSDINYALLLGVAFRSGNSNLKIKNTNYILVHEVLDSALYEIDPIVFERLCELGRKEGFEVKLNAKSNLREIKWKTVRKPLVSIIIPTKDRVDLLQQCIGSILAKTLYKNYEIIIVDNGSEEEVSKNYFELLVAEKRATVVQYPGEFNYSAINNYAVNFARGEFVAFVNNDIEVISENWLTDMLAQAQRDKVGCVGAKLYYPNDTVQHAGVVIGYGGVAGHAHKHFDRSSSGYMNRLITAQNYSAVTAACLLVSKNVFHKVGGFDEENLKVAFNDVDLCLKVREQGYINVWLASAELYHHESISRGDDKQGAAKIRFSNEISYMKRRWKTEKYSDPAYSENLALYREDFALRTLDV